MNSTRDRQLAVVELVGFVTGVALGFVVRQVYGLDGLVAWLIPVGAGLLLGFAGRFLSSRVSRERH